MLRREPVLFIRKIDQLRRHRRNDAQNAKTNHRGKHAYPTKTIKKAGFVWQPLGVPRPSKCEATTSGNCE